MDDRVIAADYKLVICELKSVIYMIEVNIKGEDFIEVVILSDFLGEELINQLVVQHRKTIF